MPVLAPDDVLGFWFGELDPQGRARPDRMRKWFTADPAFDDEIRQRFGDLHDDLARGEHEDWLGTARGRLAYLIVLDQFSRNMFRDHEEMYAHDARAVAVALEGIELGMDRQLRFAERGFCYLPLMHSEVLAHQERCVALFEAWRDELDGELRAMIDEQLKYAYGHREIVRRFNRFPHRNRIIGRTSTPDEADYLMKPDLK
jgi:uncharacterized protein (DUF924 family)